METRRLSAPLFLLTLLTLSSAATAVEAPRCAPRLLYDQAHGQGALPKGVADIVAQVGFELTTSEQPITPGMLGEAKILYLCAGVRLTGTSPADTVYWGKDSAVFIEEILRWLAVKKLAPSYIEG